MQAKGEETFMGDTVITNGVLIPQRHMQAKGEETFMGDTVITKSEENLKGREYEEERDWYSGPEDDIQYTFMFITKCFSPKLEERDWYSGPEDDIQYTFMFITKCYSEKLEKSIRSWKEKYGSYPDFILINSCLWDINR